MRFRRIAFSVLMGAVVLFGLAVVALVVLNPERATESCIRKAHMAEGESIEGLGWRLNPPGYHCAVTRRDRTVDELVVAPW
ncbi:hypothetical protein [Streptomyces spiramyceticus]|uniref:hypothetical protein n=1 Tax=Streptomyces spiramyceticus TaxID=299717 RepID=UPI00237AF6D2|nr:hypothetical protein [Streptomyces spiramyceticus]